MEPFISIRLLKFIVFSKLTLLKLMILKTGKDFHQQHGRNVELKLVKHKGIYFRQ